MNRQQAAALYVATTRGEVSELGAEMFVEAVIDLNYDDAFRALVELKKQQTFVSEADIRSEVKRIRAARVGRAPEPDLPHTLTQAEDRQARKAYWSRVGDGEPPAAVAKELGCRDPSELKPRALPWVGRDPGVRGQVPGVLTQPVPKVPLNRVATSTRHDHHEEHVDA